MAGDINNKVSFLLFIGIFSLFIWSCTPDEEIINYNYSGGLEFSTDSVVFDTIFSGKGSVTRRFTIRNAYEQALEISSITLSGGNESPFSISINGVETTSFSELKILGKDSALVLVEVFINPGDASSPYLVQDSLLVNTNGIEQQVKFIAWGQDALYIGNEVLECDAVWTNDKPIVMYQSVLVDSLCRLTIEKGTQIFAAKNAFLYIKGQLITEGTSDSRVIFRNERLEPAYENIPGQWGGIVFLEGTHGNELNFTTIRNAVYGVRLGSPDADTIPDVTLKHTIIENMSHSGILAFTSDLYAENTLVNNCIQFVNASIAGGNYTFKHCTMANYANGFVRENPAVYFANTIVLDDGSSITTALNITLQNTIIYGNQPDEIVFSLVNGAETTLTMRNNILKTKEDVLDTLGNQLNKDPKFIDVFRYNYRLDTLSPAKDAGVNIGVLSDLDGNMRDLKPDVGAYERKE